MLINPNYRGKGFKAISLVKLMVKSFFEKYYRCFFLGLTLLLLYPTFQKGYIFILDWEVNPNISLSDITFFDPILIIFSKLLAIIFSFGIYQKIFLFVTVYFLGLAGFRLAKGTGNIYARYFAGLFFIFNPFIYARLIEQPGIAIGSMLFFWFLIYFLEYLEEKNIKKIISASLLAGLAISFFPHSVFFVGLSISAILFFEYLKNRDWRFFLKTLGIIFSIIILINANWMIPFFGNSNKNTAGIAGFTSADWEAFDTDKIGGDSIYATVLALQGYWGEFQDRFVSIRENPLWIVAFWMIFFLAILGLAKRWKGNYLTWALLFIFAAGYVLAIGVASPITKSLSIFLYNHIPLYIGLREPQKWVVVLVFFYAYFGSWGIKYLLDKVSKNSLKEFAGETGIFLAILPIIFSFSIIRGMHEHLEPRAFPSEWLEAKNYLNSNLSESGGKVLIFPWHLYVKLDFAGKNINNPAKNYFGKNIIQGNNTEFNKVYTHSNDEQTQIIERYVIRDDNPEKKIKYDDFSFDMKELNIKMVILLKTEDWQKYAWLDRMNMKKVLENNKLIIYK
jgi:hypothetical protein